MHNVWISSLIFNVCISSAGEDSNILHFLTDFLLNYSFDAVIT